MTSPNVLTPYMVRDFKGLNTYDRYNKLDDGEFTSLLNWDIDKGCLVKRAGFDLRASAPAIFGGSGPLRMIGHTYLPASHSTILANGGNGKVAYSADGGATWTEALNIAGSVSMNVVATKGKMYADSLVFGTDGAKAWYFDPATNKCTQLTAAPSEAYFGDIVLDRLFVFAPSTGIIRYSDPGSFTGWPAANSIQIGSTGDGDELVSLVGYKDRLVIFKQKSIYILYMTGTPVNWQLKKFNDGIGCSGYYNTVIAEDYIYFVGHFGVYRTNLSTIEELSTKIFDKFQNRITQGNLAVGSFIRSHRNGCITYRNNRLICFVNVDTVAGGTTFEWLIYNTRLDCWTQWVPDADKVCWPYNFIHVENSNTGAAFDSMPLGLYFSENADTGKINHWSELNPKTDEGDEYWCSLTTKEFDFDSDQFEIKKIPYFFFNWSHGADSEIDVYYNGVLQFFVSEAVNAAKQYKVRGPGYVNKLQVMLVSRTGAGANNDSEIRSFGFAVRQPRPYALSEAN